MADLPTFPDLLAQYIQRVITYSDDLTYFGENSVNYAMARADASLGAQHQALNRALLRRHTLIGADGDDAVEVASEHGARRRGGVRARMLVVFRPHVAKVTAITGALIEVADASAFEAGDSIRIRSADGSTTELLFVAAITLGTGPNSGDELDVGSIVNAYTPATENVSILLRASIAEGTVVRTQSGITFETLEALQIGDSNAVLSGESSTLALNDKVWAEATVRGAAGNVGRLTVTGLETPNADVKDVLNPERAFGGRELESLATLKRRAAHQAQDGAQETGAYFEAVCKGGNRNVLRVFPGDSTFVNTIQLIVVSRNGGGLATDELRALELYVQQRVRSEARVELVNATMTAVEVDATVTLDPGTATAAERLEAAYVAAADRLAAFIDFRKWQEGADVDEADLLSIVNETPGIATVNTAAFLPAADVAVAATSVPVLTRLVLTDETSNETIGADLTPEF